ncbi:MAG: EpsG family protein [Paludibacter sp.]|nr:EpsG family protein [Paludibacter sp.]
MLIYYIFLFLFLFFAIFENKLTKNSKLLIIVISGVILILFAGLRGERIDRDYHIYQLYYKLVPSFFGFFHDSKSFFSTVSIEPSFILIFSILKSFFNNGFPIAIFFYALLGVTLKIKAIVKISDQILMSLLIYFTTIFLLQDMNQIRIGVAIGFILLSIPFILERNIVKFSIFIVLAVFFHYSAIIFAPFYFLNFKKINKVFYISLLSIPILLKLINFNPIELLLMFDFGLYTNKLKAYIEMQHWLKADINLFNFSILIQLFFSTIFIFISEKIENKYAVLLTKIYCFGIASFYLFSFSSVIAFRLSELLTSVQILLLPMLISIIKPKVIAEFAIIIISILYFTNQIVVNNIFHDYVTIFQ